MATLLVKAPHCASKLLPVAAVPTCGPLDGGYSGFSFKVVKGARDHGGGTRGHYVQGDGVPTPIDNGTVTVTNQRVVFQGTKQAREWAFSKLIGVQHDPKLPWTSIQVSNRQKVSGFLYDNANAPLVRFRLALALALYNKTTNHLIVSLQQQLAEHERERPPEPPEPLELSD